MIHAPRNTLPPRHRATRAAPRRRPRGLDRPSGAPRATPTAAGGARRALRAWLFARAAGRGPALARHEGLPGAAQGAEGAEVLLLLAEVPGAHPADLSVAVHGEVVRIASGPPPRCYRELLLPYPARLARQELRDGLLELELLPARATTPPSGGARAPRSPSPTRPTRKRSRP